MIGEDAQTGTPYPRHRMPTRSIETIAPVFLGPTLRMQMIGASDPSFRSSGDEAWLAMRFPSGPATIRFTGSGHRFDAESWGEGAEEALERAPGIIGAEDDPSGFVPEHRAIRDLARRHPALRITRSGAVTEMLLRTAIGQVVTGKEAKSSYRRMTAALGEPAPGLTELLLPPDPKVLATMAYHRFHPFGIERKRAEIIIRIASHARRMDEAAAMPLEDAYRRIRAVRGVGPWTAALVGLTAFGDADAVPVGDDNLPNGVAWVMEREPRADDARMLELLEPFRGHRGRVIRLIKASGQRAPKYGPRRQLRGIEGI